ncbi:hypothetical protein PENTCL1PPCAC_12493, partial [Pristionchus entomophagus]
IFLAVFVALIVVITHTNGTAGVCLTDSFRVSSHHFVQLLRLLEGIPEIGSMLRRPIEVESAVLWWSCRVILIVLSSIGIGLHTFLLYLV